MNKELFIKEIEKIGISISSNQIKMLDKYYDLLILWNEKINLTTITKKEDVYLKHFYDSLTLAKVIDFNSISSFCDVGTGAGFPGVVIKILYPHLKLTLIDALNKRVKFLENLVLSLELKNVEVVHARAEEYALKHREEFDVVTARAVSSLNVLIEYCLPLVKINGYFLPMKGNENIDESKNAISLLGAEICFVCEFTLPIEKSRRMIIKIKKTKKTSNQYPRRYSEIKKKPL